MFVRLFSTLICISLLAACNGNAQSVRVLKVQDGDSFIVIDQGKRQTVRISSIDAPEHKQPFGEKSKQSLKALLEGEDVNLNVLNTDPYGRLVARVWVAPKDCEGCEKSLDAGLYQVEQGMAWWYRYWAVERKEQSPVVQKLYEDAQNNAQKNRVGLWKERNPINPRTWRKKHNR